MNSRLAIAKENLNSETEINEDLYMAKNLAESFKTGVRLLILLEVRKFFEFTFRFLSTLLLEFMTKNPKTSGIATKMSQHF